MTIYPENTQRWRKGELVLHDSDAKEPRMLMRVIGYTRDGLCKTQYVFPDRRRIIWKNDLKNLHNPEQWLKGASRWDYVDIEYLQIYQENWERVRWWNNRYQPGQRIRTTSADGGFETTTGGEAKFEHGQDRIWLNKTSGGKGGWWSLKFVEAV